MLQDIFVNAIGGVLAVAVTVGARLLYEWLKPQARQPSRSKDVAPSEVGARPTERPIPIGTVPLSQSAATILGRVVTLSLGCAVFVFVFSTATHVIPALEYPHQFLNFLEGQIGYTSLFAGSVSDYIDKQPLIVDFAIALGFGLQARARLGTYFVLIFLAAIPVAVVLAYLNWGDTFHAARGVYYTIYLLALTGVCLFGSQCARRRGAHLTAGPQAA